MNEDSNKYEGWAIVELMGHNIIAGYVSEQSIAGAAMLRVDVPKNGNQEPFTKFFSGGALYGITPTSQEIATRAADRLRVRPVSEWVAPSPARPALVDSVTDESHEDSIRNYDDEIDNEEKEDSIQF